MDDFARELQRYRQLVLDMDGDGFQDNTSTPMPSRQAGEQPAMQSGRNNALLDIGGAALDYGLGPMTERSRRGLMPAEMRAYQPTAGEIAGGGVLGGILDYGPIPAKAYVDQVNRAGGAISNTLQDPSLRNATLAAGHSALALPIPTARIAGAGLGAFGLGMGAAGLEDSGLMDSSAQAAGLDVNIPLPERVTPQDRMQAITGVDVAGNRQQELELERIRAQFAAEGQAAAAAATEKAKQEGLAARESAEEKAARDALQRKTAASMRDHELAKKGSFADTQMGQYYKDMGGYAPLALGAFFGGLARAATGPATTVMGKYVAPWAVGTSGVLTGQNAPDLYDNSLVPAYNPEKAAYQVYARELPADDPNKAAAQAYADSLPDENPVSKMAGERLSDPAAQARKVGLSMVEGLGGIVGADAVGAASRLAGKARQLPGDMMEGAGSLVPRFRKGWNGVDTRSPFPQGPPQGGPPSGPAPSGGPKTPTTGPNPIGGNRLQNVANTVQPPSGPPGGPMGGPNQPPNTPPPAPPAGAPGGGPTQPPGGPMGGGPTPPPNPQPPPRQPPQAPPGSPGQGPNTPQPSKNLSSKQADKAKQDIFDAADRKGSIANVDISDLNIPPRASPATKQKYADYLDSVKQKAASTGFTPDQMRAAQAAGMKFGITGGGAGLLSISEILGEDENY